MSYGNSPKIHPDDTQNLLAVVTVACIVDCVYGVPSSRVGRWVVWNILQRRRTSREKSQRKLVDFRRWGPVVSEPDDAIIGYRHAGQDGGRQRGKSKGQC
jgi:hypothetical protein